MSYVRALTICLLLVYFVSAAGCHCFDFPDRVIVPGTTKLTFNISLWGTDANRTLVKNLGRNITRKLVVKLEGNEIISIDDCDIFYS